MMVTNKRNKKCKNYSDMDSNSRPCYCELRNLPVELQRQCTWGSGNKVVVLGRCDRALIASLLATDAALLNLSLHAPERNFQ